MQNEKRRLEVELEEMSEQKEKQILQTRILEAELSSLRYGDLKYIRKA